MTIEKPYVVNGRVAEERREPEIDRAGNKKSLWSSESA